MCGKPGEPFRASRCLNCPATIACCVGCAAEIGRTAPGKVDTVTMLAMVILRIVNLHQPTCRKASP